MTEQPISVSEVKFRVADPRNAREGLVGWASCVVNGCILLNGIAVFRDDQGRLHTQFPYKRGARDRRYFYCRPITREAKERLDEAILGRLP